MRELHVKIFAGRASIVAIFLLLLCSVSGLQARDASQTVRFPSLQPSLLEVIESIRNQTDFVFAVNLSRTDVQQRVRLSERSLTVRGAMDEALAMTDQRYVVNGRQIVVYHRDEPVPNPAEREIPPVLTDKDFERAVADYLPAIVQTDPPPQPRRDTIRTLIPHDGNYAYGDRKVVLSVTRTPSGAVTELPRVKIKTNLLYGGLALSPNLSGEVGLGRRTSVEAMGSWNPWRRKGTLQSNRKLAHIVVKPEFRYWTCERFDGHYFGVHAFFWRYNVGSYDIPLLFEKEYRYDGRALGAGISYGYFWPWNNRWGMEFNAGAGVAFMKYDRFDCQRCQGSSGNFRKTYFGPTSAGIKIVFRIK